jgi:excisionase family DNA binding protein
MPPPNEIPRFYTLAQVASMLCLSHSAVYEMIRSGEVRATKPRAKWLIYAEDIEKMLADGETNKVEEPDADE